ncbi:MAG TPA: LuxR C-terminal-related transcriptional regulator [Jiangellales bacterium]|nr:LuxR C-terminal-related transcriptional regulator [Jiangellales bacterium]
MERSGRTLTAAPLPAERSSFVGRRHELTDLRRLLSESRLVTLVGPGGVGKTRLALRAATGLQRSFRDGTAVADLAAVRDPALVVQQVAAAIGVRDDSGRWLTAGLTDAIGAQQLLLVLDNCEHLRDACAVLAHALMSTCPELRLLATSRQPLDVDGESLLVVPPLSAPPRDPSGDVLTYDAVQLLLQRARAAAPELALTEAHANDLAELCRRLDGLPLAIELAAVRLRTLTPAEVVARLDDRFRLLRRSGSSVPERHRTLRATLDWSYDLLGDEERQLWRRAAVFAADFDLAAAEAVCAGSGVGDQGLLDTLTTLVDASVVAVVPGIPRRRFRMLETVRAFGRELLEVAGQTRSVEERHRDWCVQLASSASSEFVGAGQVAAFERLDANHAELSAALDFCLRTPGEEPAGLAMAADLWLYWEARGHLGEGRRWLDRFLACSQPPAVRARGLVVAGYLALAATDTDAAVLLLDQGRDLAETVGEPFVAAMATQYLGQAALFGGDLGTADHLLRRAAQDYRGVADQHEAFCWADVGVIALLRGRRHDAAEAFERSLTLNDGGDPWTRSHALWGYGLVRLEDGDTVAAATLEQEALRLMREVDDRSGIALCVGALGMVAAARQEWDRAARLSGAADAVWESIPADLPGPVAVLRDRHLPAARRALGDTRWSSRYQDGAALDRRQAVGLALGEPHENEPSEGARGASTGSVLTRRQWEVAELVARGLTDRQIATRLVISPRTAESHVEQIRTRLGVRSRAEVAAWFARRT